MAVATETVAENFVDIVSGTPIDVPIPAYQESDVKVYYGIDAELAVLNTDYTVTLADDYSSFTVTPTDSLLTKINDLIAADDTETNNITVRRELDYITDTDEYNVHYTKFLSQELDRTAMRFQQLAENMKRAITLNAKAVGTGDAGYSIEPPVDGAALVWKGNVISNGPALGDVPTLVAECQASQEATAEDVITTGNNVTTCTTEAAAAANSASLAQAYAAGMLWEDVVFLTHADSPVTVTSVDRGILYVCDTSGGAIVINLPTVATLTTPPAFTVGVQKSTSDANAVTVNRNSTDVFEGGGTTYTLNAQYSGATLVADTSPTPDEWAVLPFAPAVDSRVGFVEDFAGTTAPAGTLECDGSAVSRTTYAALFAAIGTAWGAGDGSTTFNLPSLARRTLVGRGGSGTGTLGNAVGNTGGEETHVLTINEMPPHTHKICGTTYASGGAGNGGAGTLNDTGSTGGGLAHNNMQPSAVVMKVIRYR